MQLKTFTRDDLSRLIQIEGGPNLSVFLSSPSSVHEGGQDRIRIGNVIREARAPLREFWMPEADADSFLEPLRTFAENTEIARPRTHAIAMFLCKNVFEPFRVDTPIKPQWILSRAFHIRSLLPSLEQLESYFVLTLSKKNVTLFAGAGSKLEEQSVRDLSESFEQYEATFSAEGSVQLHSGGVRRSGKQAAVYHGQGGVSDSEPVDLENYLKHVGKTVDSFLSHHPAVPLILVGVDALTAKYRSVSHSEVIASESLSDKVDSLSADELRSRIGDILEKEQRRKRDHQAAVIRERDVPTETNAELILVAASEGRIDTLFIDQDAELYGMFYPDRRILKEMQHAPTGDPADASHDLIELAAVQTLKTGGTVHTVRHNEMPVDKKMAAALRF